ncbi:hypothetical protein BJY00DRAFT_308549 [Aspergillus carlsbadensis]|nr:hypothetical protein BJY00DRAFT_308549 [Aspergillus carlsbadensis]
MHTALGQSDAAVEAFDHVSQLLVEYRVLTETHFTIRASRMASGEPGAIQEPYALVTSQIVDLYASALRVQMKLASHYSKGRWSRAPSDLFHVNDWKEMRSEIDTLDHAIKEEIQTLDGRTLHDLAHELELHFARSNQAADDQLLATLRGTAPLARFGSIDVKNGPRCLKGTRASILSKIQSWCQDPDAKPIIWVHGMAGTGKSTVARTVAAACLSDGELVNGGSLSDRVLLGPTFFFDRGHEGRMNVRQLFLTLSHTLAHIPVLSAVKGFICDTIRKEPNIENAPLNEQWRLKGTTLLLIFDALDEASSSPDMANALRAMHSVNSVKNLRVKILLTSWKVEGIQNVLGKELGNLVEPVELLSTNSVPGGTPMDDITLFVKHELGEIRHKLDLVQGWPSQDDFESLVQKCEGLFLYAATACRFLANADGLGDLEARLQMILASTVETHSPEETLDKIYDIIVKHALEKDEVTHEWKESFIHRFQQEVGGLMFLLEAVSLEGLSSLLSVSKPDMRRTLRDLSPIIKVPTNNKSPIRLLHQSFRDYLLAEERCKDARLRVNKQDQHGVLAECCLRLIRERLQKDICGLGRPGILAAHLCQGPADLLGSDDLHDFLETNFLQWLEAMSLPDQTYDSEACYNTRLYKSTI